MKHFVCIILLGGLLAGCNNHEVKSTAASAGGDAGFDTIAAQFLKSYLDWHPQTAVGLGLHEYDGKMPDCSKASLDIQLSQLKDYDLRLDEVDTITLSKKMFYDFRILRMAVRNEITNYQDLNIYSVNPMVYAGLVDVNLYLKRNYAPLQKRLLALIEAEKQVPSIFAAAKANLADTLAKPFIETAIAICEGNTSFMKKDLLLALQQLPADSMMKAFQQANDTAVAAINSFVQWLQKSRLPTANQRYAIGATNYRKMLLYSEGLSVSPEQILAVGMAELKKEQARFTAAAAIIDPSKKPSEVFHTMQQEHPVADSLIPFASKHLEMVRQFLVDKKIVTMPSEVRVQVKETPAYARSTSTASMDVAGPFEKSAESYYYITPVDEKWTEKQKNDWLAQFDYYSTDNITVHEAYPGHYTQFLHLNASAATKIEKVFGSYAFVEGWAHYCELMMVEEGFAGSGDSIKSAKYGLAQSADALLRICRLCVSVKIHCQGMTVEEATRFFMDNWYQGEKPSHQEALRGSFDPGYLFYTVGKLELLKLREDYKKQEGANYNIKKFHDAVLDNGMPPVSLLREVLLTDKAAWAKVL